MSDLSVLRDAARCLEEAENIIDRSEMPGIRRIAVELRSIEVQLLRRLIDESNLREDS